MSYLWRCIVGRRKISMHNDDAISASTQWTADLERRAFSQLLPLQCAFGNQWLQLQQAQGPLGGPLPPRLQFDILMFLKPADIQSVRRSGTDACAATHGIFSMQRAFACSFCMSPARLRCNACRSVFYCSRGHQCGHWLVHRVTCCVLRAKRKPIIFPGRRRD